MGLNLERKGQHELLFFSFKRALQKFRNANLARILTLLWYLCFPRIPSSGCSISQNFVRFPLILISISPWLLKGIMQLFARNSLRVSCPPGRSPHRDPFLKVSVRPLIWQTFVCSLYRSNSLYKKSRNCVSHIVLCFIYFLTLFLVARWHMEFLCWDQI